jgi:hypothetical protein
VQGYEDQAGVPRATGGDDEAPWLKTPPFPASVQSWFTATTGGTPDLPIGDYVFTTPIDVEQRRVITVWIDFTVLAAPARLSLVPQVFDDAVGPDGAFFNTVVIDPTLTARDLSTTVLALPEAGSREFRPAEFRSPVLPPTARWRVVIPFDVTMWSRFRLAAGVVVGVAAGGALALGYSFSD